jgi:hypothetical protein
MSTQISYGLLALTERKRAKTQERNDKLAAERAANAAALKTGGFGDRNPDRFNEPSTAEQIRAFQMTKSRTYSAQQEANEQVARQAYQEFKQNGFVTEAGRSAAARFFNAMHFDRSTFAAGKAYLLGVEAEKRFS